MARSRFADKKTIEFVVKNGLCTGCGTCVALCPRHAMDMVIDRRKGLYLPRLNEETCNNCGLCFDVCPGHAVDFRQLSLGVFGREPEDVRLGNYLRCYTGHATQHDIRYASASGGLVTALLVFALEEGLIDGALVTRMKADKPLEPEPFVARTREDIISAARSKYCPVPANLGLTEILQREGKYAVVGLPCHVHAIRKAEQMNKRLKDRVVLHLGLFCAVSPTFLGTEFLLQDSGVAISDVKRLDYRGQGWPGRLRIMTKDGGEKSFQFPDIWADEAVGGTVLFFCPTRCRLCPDGYNELADISLGDAWMEKYRNEKIGKSALICRNAIGDGLIQKAASPEGRAVEVEDIDADGILQGLEFKSRSAQANATLFKALRIRIKAPSFNRSLAKPGGSSYLRSVLYVLVYLATSERRLWWLLRAYTAMRRKRARASRHA